MMRRMGQPERSEDAASSPLVDLRSELAQWPGLDDEGKLALLRDVVEALISAPPAVMTGSTERPGRTFITATHASASPWE